jgi:MarR family transcriptional regulator for hemolysin
MRPDDRPVGLELALTAKAVSRAFNAALAEAGGTVPVWLVLNSLASEPQRTQLDLARFVGIEGPTLTRHLDGLEQSGLVERHRDTADRRAVRVELTDAGKRLHRELLKAVIAFSKELTAGLTDPELIRFKQTLTRLQHNVRSVE